MRAAVREKPLMVLNAVIPLPCRFTDERIAVFFGQKGLMAGVGMQGSKITRIHP
jgi:hypothetical protein